MTILRDALPSDINYIDSLRKKEGSALGFIPIAAYESVASRTTVAKRDRWKYQTLMVTEDNGDLTGFCYVSYSGQDAHIFQIVVQQDARRWQRALLMADQVERDARNFGKRSVTCRVAVDLESNLFWTAIGYIPIRRITSTWLNQRESKSRRELWHYEKPLSSLFMES